MKIEDLEDFEDWEDLENLENSENLENLENLENSENRDSGDDWGLTSLILTGNRISDEGVISLVSAIVDTSYKITENVIFSETKMRRQDALRSIQHTEDKHQNSNEIIHCYTPIQRMALNHNQMTWKGEEKLKGILKNKRLHSLNGEDVILLL